MRTWFWHEGDIDQGWDCDFERMGLQDAFRGLGVNPKPMLTDEGDPAGGDNYGFLISHYNEYDFQDPNAEFPRMRLVEEQKYVVGGKEYTASSFRITVSVKLMCACRLPALSTSSCSTSRRR